MISASPFPDGFDPTSSILFLGSGFSKEGTNIADANPPVGRELAQQLIKLQNLPLDSDYDLKDIATHAYKKGIDLHSVLTNLFTIKSLTIDQRNILAQKWRRIYTTNYDDAAEWYLNDSKTKPRPKTYSFDDPFSARVLPGTTIHLHGYIHRCTKENVLNELILTHFSYAEQFVKQSPWWEQFEKDLRTAEGIFFVGYSLGDFAVASYLTKNPTFTQKTHFILSPDIDPVTISRIEDYGLLHTMAVKGFAAKCSASIPRQTELLRSAMQAFVYFNPHKDNKSPSRPTALEIDALMTLGNFKLPRLLATFPKPLYVIPRTDAIDQAVEYLKRDTTLIVHSKIGNGKSIFRHCLAMRLSELGHSCFECRGDVTIPEREIELLRAEKKPVIIFPNFDIAYALLGQLTGLPETTRYIVEMNTSTLQVRSTEVHSRLLGQIRRLDLNHLTRDDWDQLQLLLDSAGIAPNDLKLRFGDHPEMRDVVLSLYNNGKVRARIDSLVSPMLSDSDFKRVLYCAVILKSLDLKIDAGFLRLVTGLDPYQALTKFNEAALEIMNFDLDRMEPHSALFSEYLIRHYFEAHELIDWIYKLCAEAARRTHEVGDLQSVRNRDARHALGTLLTHSRLREFLDRHANRDELIRGLYEQGRNNVHINNHPLFWLQYSIFMQAQGEWAVAEKHMETAYDRAAVRSGFKTYQLDTNSFSLYIELEKQDSGSSFVTRFESIAERLDGLGVMLSDGNHRAHALKVLMKMEDFVRLRRSALSTSEATRLTYYLHLLIEKLEAYDVQLRAELGSDQTKASLKHALEQLLKPK